MGSALRLGFWALCLLFGNHFNFITPKNNKLRLLYKFPRAALSEVRALYNETAPFYTCLENVYRKAHFSIQIAGGFHHHLRQHGIEATLDSFLFPTSSRMCSRYLMPNSRKS